jgi:Tol biopolymer transport system component
MTLNFEPARWSPQGNEIVFSAHTPDASHFSSLWVVHADGSGLRQIPIESCRGSTSDPAGFGCVHPAWSPDGRQIVFTRVSAATDQRDIYTVNADGSDLSPVATTLVDEEFPDWGIHPVAP